MDLQMTTVLTLTYINTISTSLAVDDAVSNFGLLWRRSIRIKVSWIKLKKDILYSWLTHSSHQYSCQRDSEHLIMFYCLHEDKFL